ncbi:hypothetical protein L5515_007515 [Caenorhabditis briggsae]|uniref:Uncharacterized protein n=1 Tax=Caenorhabditis briggsae TaxID=6238 RepID=A0AAE9JLA8_CAEBR|nr:hypothetical protein L5515_007515 [Caenorhabditis briggsae]
MHNAVDNLTISVPKIDKPTKAALDYVELLRESFSAKKRQKFSKASLAIRPSDFPDLSNQLLCDILVRVAYNGSHIDEDFRKHVLDLVEDQSLTWNQVLLSVIRTQSDQLYMKSQLCELITEMIRFVQIKSFHDPKHADSLISVILPTFVFLTKLILELLSDEDEMETIQIEYETKFPPYHKPLQALNTLIHDNLCGPLLAMYRSSEEVTRQLVLCSEAFSKLERADESSVGLLDLILEKHQDNCKPTKYEYTPDGLAAYDLKNPSVRILVPIFACFRCHETSKQMAETVQIFVDIMRVSGDDVVFDLLHAAILLKCEESNNLLHLSKQHRLDFRWQSTTFFYKKLPQIIEHLVSFGKVTAEDVQKGMERALNDLTMLFDVADISWQNASFLTVLNALEPLIGSEAANPLRHRRREYMRKTASLTALADSDEKLIENTDIDRLLNAVKQVMNLQFGQNEEFYQEFIRKVNGDDCEDFDAVMSILISEGRLLEVGKAFAMKSKLAQYPSELSLDERIKKFDETFLLLTRIIVKFPGLSIGLLVNGGPGEISIADSIFYRWSMWYVKRVPRKDKSEEKSEEELEAMRIQAKVLIEEINKEVGIEEEIEEEEEDVEPEVVKEMKESGTEKEKEEEEDGNKETKNETANDEEMPGDEQKTEEKMDTSETPAEPPIQQQSTPEDPPKVVEEPAERINQEKPEEKPKEPLEPTWNEMNCALPRISRKKARRYLGLLKQGNPFWSTDNNSLNIGAILAALPSMGKLLIEEHNEEKHRVDRKSAEEHMANIIHALESMPCLFVCLVQWVDCAPASPARTLLAKTMKNALEKRVSSSSASIADDTNLPKWRFILSTCNEMIHELTDRVPVFPDITCTAFSAARRLCPFVTRDEIPDSTKLKHAWYYMCQQSWTSPHALRLLEHANIHSEYNTWIHLYITKIVGGGCGEIMKDQVDMIFGMLMMDDLNVIIRMHEIMMDFWLSEEAGNLQLDGRFDPLSMTAVIRLMANVMLISEWTLDRLINDGPPLVEFDFTSAMTPEPEDPLRREKWVFLLRQMLDRTVNRLFKILRQGVLCTVVNTIVRLIKAIAGSADCKAKRLLIKRIPPEIVFQLAYIEPQCADYALMNAYCDPKNEEHTRTKIRFLCALRRSHIL